MLLLLSATIFSSLSFAAGDDFMGDLMAPANQYSPNTKTRYEYRHYGNAGSNHESFNLNQSKLDLSATIGKTDQSRWSTHAFAESDSIKTKASFANAQPMPNRLWNIGTGLSHSRSLDGDRTIGGNFTISSASNQPFSAGRDLGFSLNLAYKIAQENEAAWIFFLSLSNTRGFLNYIPLPGVAYSFKAGERTRMVLGIPFMMIFWRPSDSWMLSFFYFPIRTAELKLAYGSPRGIQPYALASLRSRNFRLTGRSDKEERLFNDEGLFQAGLNIPLSRNLAVDIGGGLAFARRYFLAKKASESNSATMLVKVENAAFGHLKASASF